MMKRTRYFSVVVTTLLPIMVLSLADSGCGKKDDDELKPPVSAAPLPPPTPSPAPTPAPIVPEEDAGAPPVDAGTDAKPVVAGSGGAAASIAKCCAALQGNANSAPPEQKGAYASAAAACQGLKGLPAAQQAFAQIRTFLAGAKMPGACQ